MKYTSRLMGIAFTGICLGALCGAAVAADKSRIELDVNRTGAVISPLLFGHNLEHTRRALWQGISAEMVANRKFAAVENGVPKRWCGQDSGGRVSMDETAPYAGKHSVRVEAGNALGGWIEQQQSWLSFEKGTQYAFRVRVRTEKGSTLWLRIMDAGKTRTVHQAETTVQPGDWQLWEGSFTASATEANARLEIGGRAEGVFWIRAVSLMPANNFHGMRRDVVDLFKTLQPGCLRWPGGCFAEYYVWQDGLLPVDQRPPLGPAQWDGLLPDTDGYDNHEIGIDEYMALCRELNCVPAITIRYGQGSPEEAAAWVEYCNGGPETRWGRVRAERGHAEPYGVKYWYVGNEIWGISLVKDRDPRACAVRSRHFAEAMKKADPGLELIGCAPAHDPAVFKDWLAPLLAEAGDSLGLVQTGYYFPKPEQVTMKGVVEAPRREVLPLMRALRKFADRAAPGGRRLGMAFYEWNSYWGRPGDTVSGVFAAGMLNLFCREAEPLGLVLAGYFQPVTEGAIRVEPSACAMEPAGQVFALYAAHQGNRLLKTPETSSDIDLCASVAPDGGLLCVTALNRNTDTAHTLELSLANFTGTPQCTVSLLKPRTLEVRGEFERVEEKPALKEGKSVEVTLPPCAVARILFSTAAP